MHCPSASTFSCFFLVSSVRYSKLLEHVNIAYRVRDAGGFITARCCCAIFVVYIKTITVYVYPSVRHTAFCRYSQTSSS